MKKQKNEGFTLVELLAVIIVLAIISLIAVPIILGIIDEVKKAAFERSVEMSIKSFDLYRAKNEEIKRIEITDERLPLDDNHFISGSLLSLTNGQIEAYKITDGNYCASGIIGELEVTTGACINDILDDFVINTYFLNVNPNGGMWNGSEEISEVLVENNSKINLINPIKTGYAFTGWEMNVVASTDSEDNGILTTEMVANWVGNNYKLVIDSNGGVYEESTENKIVDVIAGESIELKTPTKKGYKFVGWEVTGLDSHVLKNLFIMGVENATVTAKWEGTQYTINYDCNGGEGSTPSSTHIREVASSFSTSGCYKIIEGTGTGNNAEPMIYYVSGWSTTSDASTAVYNAEDSVTFINNEDSVTLYAVWDRLFTYTKKYTVSDEGLNNWKVKFLETGNFISKANLLVDTFLVGGGGGGNGGGGAGGKTNTVKKVQIEKNKTYAIAVGLGGDGGDGNDLAAKNGESSSAFGYSAVGGGKGDYYTGSNNHYGHGGDGGSGGGGSFRGGGNGGNGGYNGGNGGSGNENSSSGGSGQGPTTREFGENGGIMYAGGGGGCAGKSGDGGVGGSGGGGNGAYMYGAAENGDPNTGGGGGGACYGGKTGSGGSGIVIIRNTR